MLDAPKAREVMVAVRSGGGIMSAVGRAASVIVNRGLVIPVNDIQCSIRTDAGMNGGEPGIGAGKESGIFGPGFRAGDIGRAVRSKDIIMDEANGWLVEKNVMIPGFRPCAAVVETAAGRCGEHANPVDLQIRLAGGMDQRRHLLMVGNNG